MINVYDRAGQARHPSLSAAAATSAAHGDEAGAGHHHPGGRLVFHVFAALAEFIRELIVEGTREGVDAARGRGVRLGRPPAMTAEQIRHARDLLTRPDNAVSSIARLRGVSRATIYKYVPALPGRPRPAAAVPLGRNDGRSSA